jgi:hypothetical protein
LVVEEGRRKAGRQEGRKDEERCKKEGRTV